MKTKARPRVVVIGAGFAGLWAARALARYPVDVLLIDRNNYHTFWPLLYQVAAAELEPDNIIYPVRTILRKHRNVGFLMATVEKVDLAARMVHTSEHPVPYDYLVLAPGSTAFFFGVPGAAEYAFPLRSMEEGLALRNHILFCFEEAVHEEGPVRRRRLLTFAIVGGGPTGVEFAGALVELIRGPLHKDFPSLNPDEVHVVLLEAMDRLLSGMPESLGRYALEQLRKKGVDVRLKAVVSKVTPEAVHLKDGEPIPTETVAWTAGVRAHPLAEASGLPTTKRGQVEVLPTLQVPGHPEVYVVGDLAAFQQEGQPLPMLAAVAIQEGEAAARNIGLQVEGKEPQPFVYKDKGIMAVIGRNAAAARLGKRTYTGFPAWVLWLGYHLFKLIGFRNRLIVLVNWAWAYLFFERAVKAILPLDIEGGSQALRHAFKRSTASEEQHPQVSAGARRDSQG